MKGGNIRSILTGFANRYFGKVVTVAEMCDWIAKNVGVTISPHILEEHLYKHKRFRFRYTGGGKTYRVVVWDGNLLEASDSHVVVCAQ